MSKTFSIEKKSIPSCTVQAVLDILNGIFWKAFTSSKVALFSRKPENAWTAAVSLNEGPGQQRKPDLHTTKPIT